MNPEGPADHAWPTSDREREPVDLVLRPATDADLDFLYRAYCSTRSEDMALMPLCEKMKADLLDLQFRAQRQFYEEQFPDADHWIVEEREEPIGRLSLDRREDEFRLIDITLLPDRRGAGIGGLLIRRVQDEAAAAGKPVRLHVDANNPALRLYGRLGFRNLEEHGIHFFMEWKPPCRQHGTAPRTIG